MNKIKNIKQNKGQIAIIVLLVSAVILSLGLSASKKTVVDTKIATDEELLKEAFNTAESGINNYINIGSTAYDAGNGSNATITKTDIGGGSSSSLSSEGLVLANTNQLFWLVNHNDNGGVGATYYTNGGATINLAVDVAFNGALKIDYFYLDNANAYKVSRLICNYNGSNVVNNGLAVAQCNSLVTADRRPLLIVVTPLGGNTNLTISGSSPFPIQGQQLTSVGSVNDSIKTQITTKHIYQIPPFFIEAITAQGIIQ